MAEMSQRLMTLSEMLEKAEHETQRIRDEIVKLSREAHHHSIPQLIALGPRLMALGVELETWDEIRKDLAIQIEEESKADA